MTQSRRPDSNRRHPLYERGALPTELRRRGSAVYPGLDFPLVEILVASTPRRRLLGLAFRRRPPENWALLFPALQLGSHLRHALRDRRRVSRPRRAGGARRTRPAAKPGRGLPARRGGGRGPSGRRWHHCGHGGRSAQQVRGGTRPSHADLSRHLQRVLRLPAPAGGAIAGTQVPVYILMAITGLWGLIPFVAACVVFELGVIFGLARPQMQPRERLAWAGAWAGATALMAVAFYTWSRAHSLGRAREGRQAQAQRAERQVLAHIELERLPNVLTALGRLAQAARVATACVLGQPVRMVGAEHGVGAPGQADEVAEARPVRVSARSSTSVRARRPSRFAASSNSRSSARRSRPLGSSSRRFRASAATDSSAAAAASLGAVEDRLPGLRRLAHQRGRGKGLDLRAQLVALGRGQQPRPCGVAEREPRAGLSALAGHARPPEPRRCAWRATGRSELAGR